MGSRQQAASFQVCGGQAQESVEAIAGAAREGRAAPEEHAASSIAQMAEQASELVKGVVAGLEEKLKPQRSHIADYVGLLDESEKRLWEGFEQLGKTHPDEPDIGPICKLFKEW